MARLQLTGFGRSNESDWISIVTYPTLASFAVSVSEAIRRKACSYWIAPHQSASFCQLFGAIDFDWPPKTLTSQGDICYGASAISGLNLHFPSSKS